MSVAKYFVGQKWKLIQAFGDKRDTSDGYIYELKQNELAGAALIDENNVSRCGYHAVKDRNNITQKEWDNIAGMHYTPERKYELMNPDYDEQVAPVYIPPTKVLKVGDIQHRILRLSDNIRREANSKEKARLVDEQAALKFTLRVMDTYTTRGKCVR